MADISSGKSHAPGVLSQDSTANHTTSKTRVIVFGAHPDDPESGCGGLIAQLTKTGHEVIVAYATCFRGDRKIGEEPEGVVRKREAACACEILGAQFHIFDYAHEKLMADNASIDTVGRWIKSVQPDIVITHWPIDTHPNHHVTSSLVWHNYLRQKNWTLYFFEVMTDQQTLAFEPNLYLDIENELQIKKRACECHQSQNPQAFWEVHEAMHARRGRECGTQYAEAYLLVEAKKELRTLPIPLVERQRK